ncbi:MAG: nitrite reductase large subunit NirB [Candidatus Methylomirabilis sp.]|nr:nitrite reductase large subunit NirB [Deltaproteobacteria bacterium]
MAGNKRERLVVVGNGMAANAFIEEVLKAGPEKYSITVFGKEGRPGYNRVLLSQVLTGEKEPGSLAMHDPEWYAENGAEVRQSEKIVSIKRGSRKVVTERGLEAGYDKLVLATGSLPVVPGIEGRDLPGVVSFRDLDDCERILAHAREGRRAVVIGGGLLGLEAAGALRSLGMEVLVVHIMDRLMERQLDGCSAGLLMDALEEMGIGVLLKKEAIAFEGHGKLERVRFRDGSAIEAGLAVVSIGVRPNIELALEAGIYSEKGVVVTDTMQTFDPSVYAIGECVQHRGETFGLVAPVFEQARVAANQLVGDGRRSFRNSPVSARLKVKGIDLYSAGRVSSVEDSIEYFDRRSRVYKKVALEDGRIAGVVLFGESSLGPSLFELLLSGTDVSHRRQDLLFGERKAEEAARIPDDAVVCGCKGVTKGAIAEAVRSKGLFTREDVKRETGASSSCGGCAPLVERVIEETLGAGFQPSFRRALCGCTNYAREDVLRNIREKGLKSVAEVMAALGWEGVGCDTCRPAINYYVMMAWPESARDDLTSRLINERARANVQKDGTFSVVPRMHGGVTTARELKKIAEVAERHNVPLLKLTGGQRIALIGVPREGLQEVWKELDMPSGHAYAKAVRTAKTCVGDRFCRYGTQDSVSLGIEMEKRFGGIPMPAKVKLAVSGCPRNCAESGIKDLGVVGVLGGWEIYAGGCGGIELKGGEKLGHFKTQDEIIEAAAAFLQLYREDADYGERTFRWVVRKGIGRIREEALCDEKKRKALAEKLEAAARAEKEHWAADTEPVLMKGA